MFQKYDIQGHCGTAFFSREINCFADIVTFFLYIITTPTEALIPRGNQCNEALCKDIPVKCL
jgi:hypothetical protein